MANKNFQKKKIQETQGSGFGKYQEAVGGGGSPEAKDPLQRAPGVNSSFRKQNNDTMQPRTNDGKFTYKSVNGEAIDPKYGPSRGKTVNPLLTGGENGIMIEDVEKDFSNKYGAYWNKYKDSWYKKGGEIVTTGDFKVRVAAETIWEVAKRRYDTVKGEFEGESSVFEETKKGRPGKEEMAAKQKAQATGEETPVIEQISGGIKLKPGTIEVKPETKPTKPTKPTMGSKAETTPVVPSEPTTEKEEEKVTNFASENEPVGSGKYTSAQMKSVRDYLKTELGGEYDPMFDDDEILEQFIDSQGGDIIFKGTETEEKIKDMGFSE